MTAAVETMAYAHEVPWHGLGVNVDPTITPAEMLKAAGLDWRVDKRPTFYCADTSRRDGYLEVPDLFVLVRSSDGECLSQCGPIYTPVQNEQIFEFFKRFTDAGHMQLETAGSLHGGRHVWALARITDQVVLPGDDVVYPYLLLSQPHIWGKSMVLKFTTTRVVCANTMAVSLREQGTAEFRMPHLYEFDDGMMSTAEEAVGIATAQFKDFGEKAKIMAKKDIDENRFNRFVAQLFEPTLVPEDEDEIVDWMQFKRNASYVRESIATQPGSDLKTKNSWWAAYNTVTHAVDHEFGSDRDHALYNAWFGGKAKLKERAFNLAYDYAS